MRYNATEPAEACTELGAETPEPTLRDGLVTCAYYIAVWCAMAAFVLLVL